MSQQLADKIALVTGGTSGIGRAVALAFARHGAKVILTGRRSEQGAETVQAIKQVGGEAIFMKADVSKATDVEATIAKAVETYGRLDCACNNAGTEGRAAPITELTEADFDAVIDTNLKGTWLCLKYEIAQMLQQGSGAIVNISSGAGHAGLPNVSPYCASKHGAIGLTKSLALEYAKKGIRINAVSPGPIDTDMVRRTFGGEEAANAHTSKVVPMGRMGTSEEVAEAVIWLCSDAASFITGQALAVDGGRLAQ